MNKLKKVKEIFGNINTVSRHNKSGEYEGQRELSLYFNEKTLQNWKKNRVHGLLIDII